MLKVTQGPAGRKRFRPHAHRKLHKKDTDKQIGALVYELYGLTEEEIKIVEGG